MSSARFILTLSCPDTVGIVHAVSGVLAAEGCNILESAQFGDTETGLFFMRVCFADPGGRPDRRRLEAAFAPVGQRFAMTWQLHDQTVRQKVLVMVSRFGHCLNDLLYRHEIGALPMDIVAVVSNHRDFEALAGAHRVPFHHLPVTAGNKAVQEHRLLDIVERENVDLVVLARYMQVLSDDLCRRLEGRAINIHHSFLPSFKGARPYHQAHARGVKLIGATAHYVTPALDEGPIIEQAVERVDHAMTPEGLAAVGRDVENVVLARAVLYHLEHRVLRNGNKTVVFK